MQGKIIFVVREGRSGFTIKSFAMRLVHLGANVYVVRETITPSISSEQIILAVSGSGKTQYVVWVARKSKELGTQVLALTTDTPICLSYAEISVENKISAFQRHSNLE